MITIYHNPRCGTSRNTLALIQARGFEPRIVEYLKTPFSHDELTRLIREAGLSVREAIRTKEALYTELGLDAAHITDKTLLDAMVSHPVLVNRPFVTTPKGSRLCRPAEIVETLL